MGRFDLYSYVRSIMESESIEVITEFVDEVFRLSQSKCPVDTGRLKNSWYVQAEQITSDKVAIKFGYDVDYAMPADYYTGGVKQIGFFSGSISEAADKVLGEDIWQYISKDALYPTEAGRAGKERPQWKTSPYAGKKM